MRVDPRRGVELEAAPLRLLAEHPDGRVGRLQHELALRLGRLRRRLRQVAVEVARAELALHGDTLVHVAVGLERERADARRGGRRGLLERRDLEHDNLALPRPAVALLDSERPQVHARQAGVVGLEPTDVEHLALHVVSAWLGQRVLADQADELLARDERRLRLGVAELAAYRARPGRGRSPRSS